MDTVLGQAVMCAYAIPSEWGNGAMVAAGLSILQAIIDAIRPPSTSPADYSTAQALADLGGKIHDELVAQKAEGDLETVQGWQQDVKDAMLTTPGYAPTGAAAFLARDFNDTFARLTDTVEGSEERVKSLGTYFMARTTYHSLCSTWLRKLLEADSQNVPGCATPYQEIHTRYRTSLSAAPAYAGAAVAALDDVYLHARERADAAAAAAGSASRHTERTARLRSDQAKAHVRYASSRDALHFRGFLHAYRLTTTTLANAPADLEASPPVPTGTGEAATPTLGLRRPGTVRFLYETDPGGRIDVTADSPTSPGGLAVQDEGSAEPGLYYRFGGEADTLDGAITARLHDSGGLPAADKALAAAYEVVYGAGAYAVDSTAPRPDRYTSLLVPVPAGTPPLGSTVYAVLYSVGPPPGARGIADEDGYRQVYADAFAAVADWNSRYPAIESVRLTLVATGPSAASRAQAAGLVIDAAVAALQAFPLLATLTLLLPTDGDGSGDVRTAFDTAAQARTLTLTPQGFDAPTTSSP